MMGRGAEDIRQNFALYSARPGTWQQMPVFFYVERRRRRAETLQAALNVHPQRRLQAAPRLQVMAQHFHTNPVPRAKRAAGGLDVRLPDIDTMKARGINIFGPWSAAAAAVGGPAAAVAMPSTLGCRPWPTTTTTPSAIRTRTFC